MRRERRSQKAFSRQPQPVKVNSAAAESFSLGLLRGVENKPSTPSSEIQTTKKRSGLPVKVYFLLFAFLLFICMFYQLPALFSQRSNKKSSLSNTLSAFSKRNGLRSVPNIMLPKPGEYAPMRQDIIIPLIKLWRAPTHYYHIFSISGEDDLASTVLTNVLMGLFDEPDEHLGVIKWSAIGEQYLTRHKNEWVDANTTVVSHTFDTDLLQLQREFRSSYRNLFFIVIDRGQAECAAPQAETIMICVPLADLMYQGIEDEKVVISRIVTRIQTELPYFSKIDFSIKQLEALRRLTFMYDMQLQMRDMPKTSLETKYGIKGGTAMSQ